MVLWHGSITDCTLKELASGYDRYTHDSESQHEAGFDAYMTGTIYIGFVRYIQESEGKLMHDLNVWHVAYHFIHLAKDKKEKKDDKEAVEDKSENKNPFLASTLTPYYNRLYQMKSDYPYLDLTGPEPTRKYTFTLLVCLKWKLTLIIL